MIPEQTEVFSDIMVDIESMGDRMDSVITSIGATAFNIETGETGPTFYINVNIQDCLDKGLQCYGSTIQWWMTKSEEARIEVTKPGSRLIVALTGLASFIKQTQDKYGRPVRLWARGPRFDFGILDTAYRVSKIDIPWKPQQECCVRTLETLMPEVKKEYDKGYSHLANKDCDNQIGYTSIIWRKLKQPIAT